MYAYLWEYEVRPEAGEAFRREYGPEGGWVTLFRRAPGYVGTQLLQDRQRPRRYVTIDTWDSAESHARFKRQFADDFAELDRRCEALTLRETLLGEFHAPSR
jgi:heme-degrading monooxygenase HmoA